MVRRYTSKIRAFPSARKGLDFYRSVLIFALCGYGTDFIARELGAPPQTVNRALKRVRAAIGANLNLWDHFAEEADEFAPGLGEQYSNVLHGIDELAEEGALERYYSCLTKCPRALPPREFVSRFITVFPMCPDRTDGIPSTRVPFRLPRFSYSLEMDAFFKRKKTCRSCPLPNIQASIADTFWRAPASYASITLHLTEVRLRGTLYEHLMFAVMRSLIGAVLANHAIAKKREGLNDDEIAESFQAMFDEVVSICWDSMPDFADALKQLHR